MNKAAFVAIGSPAAVELMYDAQARTVGLRPIDFRDTAAQYVRAAGTGRNGPFLISAMAFTKFYDIDVTTSRRWIAHLEDGILCVNLDDPAVDITNNRNHERRLLHTPDSNDERQVGQA